MCSTKQSLLPCATALPHDGVRLILSIPAGFCKASNLCPREVLADFFLTATFSCQGSCCVVIHAFYNLQAAYGSSPRLCCILIPVESAVLSRNIRLHGFTDYSRPILRINPPFNPAFAVAHPSLRLRCTAVQSRWKILRMLQSETEGRHQIVHRWW